MPFPCRSPISCQPLPTSTTPPLCPAAVKRVSATSGHFQGFGKLSLDHEEDPLLKAVSSLEPSLTGQLLPPLCTHTRSMFPHVSNSNSHSLPVSPPSSAGRRASNGNEFGGDRAQRGAQDAILSSVILDRIRPPSDVLGVDKAAGDNLPAPPGVTKALPPGVVKNPGGRRAGDLPPAAPAASTGPAAPAAGLGPIRMPGQAAPTGTGRAGSGRNRF
jgi:hypothetical protein